MASFQQSLPVVPSRMNLSSIPQTSRNVFQTSRPNVSFDSSRNDGRRTRVPCYNGKEPWSAYQMQFELISEHNNWTASVKAIELLTALKDDTMVYASFLPSDVKSSFLSLGAAIASIFGDHGYPETYRQELHTLKKLSRETIQEYASIVEMLVRNFFPTIDTATHGTLSVKYMLSGLPDQSISLELLTKRISSMTEAIRQVVLYETYKRGTRERYNIRQLNTD